MVQIYMYMQNINMQVPRMKTVQYKDTILMNLKIEDIKIEDS